MVDKMQLGQTVKAANSPIEAILDAVNVGAEAIGTGFVARFTIPEMTSICPVTGQPDFGTIVIEYVPNEYLIESKSLKLFIQSFRNHGAFHEECTVYIGKRIEEAVKPLWIRVTGYWNARGGIPIDVVWEGGQDKEDARPTYLLPHDIGLFRGR